MGKAVIVSWVTVDEPGSSTAIYWSENSKEKKHAEGKILTYNFYNYTSGFIHHTTIRNLKVTEICHTFHLDSSVSFLPLFMYVLCGCKL